MCYLLETCLFFPSDNNIIIWKQNNSFNSYAYCILRKGAKKPNMKLIIVPAIKLILLHYKHSLQIKSLQKSIFHFPYKNKIFVTNSTLTSVFKPSCRALLQYIKILKTCKIYKATVSNLWYHKIFILTGIMTVMDALLFCGEIFQKILALSIIYIYIFNINIPVIYEPSTSFPIVQEGRTAHVSIKSSHNFIF